MRSLPGRILCLLLILSALPAKAADYWVIFGTHVQGAGKGLSIAHFDTDTGKLTVPTFALQTPAPAFFVISPDSLHLYSCNSINPAGAVSAYAIDAAKGSITLLNTQPTGGGDPSYVSLDAAGRHALVANYQGGNIAVFAIKPDGSLGDRTAFIQHTGHSVNPTRQTHAYAHSIRLDAANRFAVVCDLGLDKVFVYRYDKDAGTLTPNDPPFTAVAPGTGPRHMAFHPSGRWLYVVTEIGSTIIQFNWDADKGILTPAQTISALPADFKAVSTAAEIAVHPNGKFLYVTNRGRDSIAVFSIDQQTGNLTPIQDISSAGKTPRNFALDPTGRWLLVTNHGSNNAVVFKLDPATGLLTQSGDPVPVPYPFCERFVAIK
jgi:6-phosphogluconolactonase